MATNKQKKCKHSNPLYICDDCQYESDIKAGIDIHGNCDCPCHCAEAEDKNDWRRIRTLLTNAGVFGKRIMDEIQGSIHLMIEKRVKAAEEKAWDKANSACSEQKQRMFEAGKVLGKKEAKEALKLWRPFFYRDKISEKDIKELDEIL